MSDVLCIRRLTSSDLGWFEVHRSAATSKQRAININSVVARRVLSDDAFEQGGIELTAKCVFRGGEHTKKRRLWKVGKNWRFGGPKLEGPVFREINSGDFFVLLSAVPNSGQFDVTFTFVSSSLSPDLHRWLCAAAEEGLDASMLCVTDKEPFFALLQERVFEKHDSVVAKQRVSTSANSRKALRFTQPLKSIKPIPSDFDELPPRPRTMRDRLRSPHILSHMLKVSSDLSAPAQYEFVKVLELLAKQLRDVLLETGQISKIERDHAAVWTHAKGRKIGFVDGGVANLSMLGAAPVAIRVGGYIVQPGRKDDGREEFVMAKHLIDELYTAPDGGIYAGLFPDPGALRDAARISVEAAGAAQIVSKHEGVSVLLLHGALVNPVSRYTDVMEAGQVVAPFPNFSTSALGVLLPDETHRSGRDANFIRVYRRQLEMLAAAKPIVCGVVERESQASSVYRRLIQIAIDDPRVPPLLAKGPRDWMQWFCHMVDEFRITDSLLFRCVLEPGEVLHPVDIDRNELHRAPSAWLSDIQQYPKPWVSYMLPTEWGAPVRLEVFQRDVPKFPELSRLVMHCSWLLPRYAFPVGLDIVDKYAKVPNWMSRPVNTNTAVQALRTAMENNDTTTFNAIRRMLCGSTRDWLFRPKAF